MDQAWGLVHFYIDIMMLVGILICPSVAYVYKGVQSKWSTWRQLVVLWLKTKEHDFLFQNQICEISGRKNY